MEIAHVSLDTTETRPSNVDQNVQLTTIVRKRWLV